MGRKHLPSGILLITVVAVQLLASGLRVPYYLTQLTMSAYYVMVAVGLCMLMGYAGQISLGQAGFFSIGGYTAARLTTIDLSAAADGAFIQALDRLGILVTTESIYGEASLHLSPWIACLLAVGLTIGIAYLIGRPVLSLKGHYLAMATLGFGIIIYRIVLGTRFFGEADGITNVPAFVLVPGLQVSGDFSARISNYYIAWALVIIGMVLLTNLVGSRVGRALRALHGGEEAAASMGVDTATFKLNVFILAAAYAAVAGVFLTHYNGSIGPSEAHFMRSVRYVAIVAVGGMANLWGTLIMGIVLNFLSLRGIFGSYDDAVFGAILIVIMLFVPDGFLRMSVLRNTARRVRILFSRRGGHDES